MQNKKPVSYLIDFDSTFIQSEGLDVLAEISLVNHSQKEKIVEEIKHLTQLGMNGKMPFEKSLQERVELLQSNRAFINKAAMQLKKNISKSILRNKDFFQQHKNNIYIISGGFKELILPVIESFEIPDKNVFANTFTYDNNGNVIGVDATNLMSKNQGKVKVVRSLKLLNDLYIIGDGYTDYELKKLGLAKKFIAFTENISRSLVVKHADEIAPNFDEFLFENKLPRSLSYPKNRINVLLLATIPQEDRIVFENEGYIITDSIENIHNTSIICVDEKTLPLLEHIHRTLAVGLYSQSVMQIDQLHADGIAVFAKKNIAQKIVSYINSGSTSQSLTLPNLSLPQYKNSHRLLHIHKNVPGMLAQINKILADHKINVLAQYLKTNESHGYVIIDVDKAYEKKVFKVLKTIPHTIRFRILY